MLTGDDLNGWNLHAEITTIMKLTQNKRLDTTDPDALMFDKILEKLRDGENMEEHWIILRGKRNLLAMGLDAWKNKGVNDDDVTHACFTIKLENEHDNEMTQKK